MHALVRAVAVGLPHWQSKGGFTLMASAASEPHFVAYICLKRRPYRVATKVRIA